jgi:DNA repair exonuclease SbcCD ATPase subunit
VDLEKACDDANTQIGELLPKWAKAEQDFKKALQRIKESQTELEKKWEDTEEEAEAFLKELADSSKDLEEESNNTRSAMQDLKKAVLEGKQEYEDELEKTADEHEDFGESDVHGLENPMETLAQMVGQTANSLQQAIETIESSLSKLAADTVNFFEGEISEALTENERQVTERHSQLEDWITSDARPNMVNKKGDFQTKLSELESNTQNKFDETDQRTNSDSKSVLDGMLGETMGTIQQIMSLGQTLSSTLTFLADSVQTTGQTIGAAKQTVETCVETSNITIESIMSIFEKFQKICAGFSFLG